MKPVRSWEQCDQQKQKPPLGGFLFLLGTCEVNAQQVMDHAKITKQVLYMSESGNSGISRNTIPPGGGLFFCWEQCEVNAGDGPRKNN
jgi:hypothetical protein